MKHLVDQKFKAFIDFYTWPIRNIKPMGNDNISMGTLTAMCNDNISMGTKENAL